MTDDIVGSGAVASMAWPGGNTTGASILSTELDVKRLELLHVFVPQARRIGVLIDPTVTRDRSQLEQAGRVLDVEVAMFDVYGRDEMPQALNGMVSARVEAVNVLASPILTSARGLIIERLRAARLPAIYQFPEAADEGGIPRLSSANSYCATGTW